MKLSNFHWFGLLAVSIACGSSGSGGASGFQTNANSGVPGNPNAPPGNPNAPPGPGTNPGQGGGGGDGGTGNVGQGGSGGGDCISICQGCNGGEQCPGLCEGATPDQLSCAQAALPDCDAAAACLLGGTGGSGGVVSGGGSGGGGACVSPDCTGCTDVCSACLCATNGDTELCASSCG